MTLLEKAKEIIKAEGKNVSENGIIEYSCPSDYELEEAKNCVSEGRKGCEECWNREMPNTELVKTVTLPMPPTTEPQFSNPAIEKAYNTGLNNGRNEVWEFAKRISLYPKEGGMSSMELVEIFGVGTVSKVMRLSYEEALAKLKAYEEAQKIEVGDVVEGQMSGKKAIVTRTDGSHLDVITNEGGIGCWDKEVCKKTGKHIDIKSILESIGE